MIFVNTNKFSPVATRSDMPHKDDYFWKDVSVIDDKFLERGDYYIDEEWWNRQKEYCENGVTVKNAIAEGGDYLIDGKDVIWYMDGLHKKDAYIPQYDLLIKNREVNISGRLYFYLNFWKIYGKLTGKKMKGMIYPRFLALDFFFDRRLRMMFDQEKDGQEMKGRQEGYELPNSEKVLTSKGWKNNGDLKVGNEVATRKGTYSKVMEVYPQGYKDVYEMELMDGRKVRCGLNHKWKVYSKFSRKKCEVIKTTKELIESGLYWNCNKGRNKSYKYALPDIEPVKFNKDAVLPINPYLLGLLLGDGCLGANVRLATTDEEIAQYVSNILGEDYELPTERSSFYKGEKITRYTLKYIGKRTSKQKKRYGLKSIINKFNPLVQEIRLLGLENAKAHNKFIPEIYKHSSIEQRKELVRGLMDSDGHISPKGTMEFKVVSEELANDFVYVLRSLGVGVRISEGKSTQGYRDFYRVHIRLTHFNPFKLKRKAGRFNSEREIYKRTPIINITKLSYKEESTCIEIEDTDHIYLMTDFIPTHNSEKMGGMIMGFNFSFVKASQNVIIGGQQEDADKTFLNTVRGLNDLRNTQFYKERDRTSITEGYLHAKHFLSEIYSLTAKHKEQAVSRLTPYFVVYEEIGKGDKDWSLKVSSFVKASLYAEGEKTGWQLFVGTGGDMMAGAADLEARHYNPDVYNILSFQNIYEKEDMNLTDGRVGHFTGKQWLTILDENGNPEFEKSKKVIRKHIESSRPQERHKEISQWAIYTSDALMRSTIGFFGEEIIPLLQRRKFYLLAHREERIVRKGRLIPKNMDNLFDGVEFVPDEENGWISIIEEPELDSDGKPYGNLYKAGSDSYDQDEAMTSDSKGSMVVRKLFRNDSSSPHYLTYVALILERPKTEEGGAEIFYRHTVLTCIYYGCKNNIEYSNLRIFDFYINNGFEVLLEERPRIAFAGKITKTQVSNRYGTDKSLKPHILAILKDRLTESFISRMYFIDQIDRLSKFIYGRNYNCDVTIATAEAEVAAKEIEFYVVKSREEDKKLIKGYIRYKMVKGELVQVIR